VLLTRKKDTQKVFAMKILNKQIIIERNEVEHTKSEKSILTKLDFPFLVKMHYAFQTPDKLYFVMDYINGGKVTEEDPYLFDTRRIILSLDA
jgi:serine/threonine protein kinase